MSSTPRDKGRPERSVEGGIMRPCVERLMVGKRDRTALLDGMEKQVDVVSSVLSDTDAVPVHGALCFVGADWPLIGGSFTIRDVHVVWPRKLIGLLQADGPLMDLDIERVARTLARCLPAA